LLTEHDKIKGGLVATETEDGIALGGYYIPDTLDDRELQELQSSLSLVNSKTNKIQFPEKRLLEGIERAGIKKCSVVFPQK